MNDYVVSLTQLENMKHCIGFRNDRIHGRIHRKYTTFRNYFTTSDDHPGWDRLVEQGLAEKRPFPSGGGSNPQIYAVTDACLEFLSKVTGVTITEGD